MLIVNKNLNFSVLRIVIVGANFGLRVFYDADEND